MRKQLKMQSLGSQKYRNQTAEIFHKDSPVWVFHAGNDKEKHSF